MANEISTENVRTWIAGFQKKFVPSKFLHSTLFGTNITFKGEEVLMDYKKGGVKMAPFAVKGSNVIVGRDGFKTLRFKPPMLAPARIIDIPVLEQRAFDENPLNPMSEAEKAARYRAEDFADMRDMIDRRLEWEAAQLLINGKFEAKGYADDGSLQVTDTITIDGWDQTKELTGDDAWTNTKADIYEQINELRVEMSKKYCAPTMLIANSTTIAKFLKNESLHEKMVIPKDASFATIVPQVVNPEITRYAVLTPGNIEVYGYDGIYVDDEDSQVKSLIPDGYIVLTRPGIGRMLSGAITQYMEDGQAHTFPGMYVPKEVVDVAKDIDTISLRSRTVPCPLDVDSWYTVKVF